MFMLRGGNRLGGGPVQGRKSSNISSSSRSG